MRIFLASLWTVATIIGLGIPATGLSGIDLEGLDKIIHFLLFFVFGFLWMAALRSPLGRRTAIVFIIGLMFAIGTEVFQGVGPFDRSPDSMDVVADFFGLIIGIGLFRALHQRLHAVQTS